jgi:hypothetical protein
MSEHLDRLRRFLDLETQALRTAAERSRVLDHHGSRGSDVEHTVRQWLRRLVEPEYTASAGEIIDSFDTDADLESRQQDIVIHQQSVETNAFVLPSGLRLIPIESVAAVVEVKLSLDAKEFRAAEQAAAQTSRLRLALHAEDNGRPGYGGVTISRREVEEFNELHEQNGALLSHPKLFGRTTFAVFGLDGPSGIETLAQYVAKASIVRLLTCLNAGTVHRVGPSGNSSVGRALLHRREDALLSFAHAMVAVVRSHQQSTRDFVFQAHRYYHTPPVWYWDSTGLNMPEGYLPCPDELSGREAMFPGRKFVR